MSLENLSDDGCVAALSLVGVRVLSRAQLDLKTSAAFVRASADGAAIPQWAEHPAQHLAVSGPVARFVLKAFLEGDDERLQRLARGAIAEQEGAAGQVVEWIVAGGFLIALAILSKTSYSKEKGLELAPGFPDLAKVLDDAAKLLSAATGVGVDK
jgi:hypothetical protein